MRKLPLPRLALLALAAILGACAPKAIVVAEPTPAKKANETAAKPDEAETVVAPKPALPDDGIRLPDMMTLPSDEEIRSTEAGPSATEKSTGAVIARPPIEPPPRRKPTESE